MSLSRGTRLGPYQVIDHIGDGGMASVYRARDTRLDRDVAIKVLADHRSDDPGRRARLEREARILSQLNHPNICALFDIGEHEGRTYLVLELLAGETLASRLERASPRGLALADALPVAVAIATALAAAHRHGIVHRDLKPGNVMLTKTGVKLLDFGIARSGGRESAPATAVATLTADGTLLGTVPYMAPEQLEGHDADSRTDIFAFGAVLYEMVSGRRAFEGESESRVIAAVLEHDPPPLSEWLPSAPRALVRIVEKCLAKEPDARWQSALDLSDALRWLLEADRSAPPPAPSVPLWRRASTLVVAIGVLTMAVGTFAIWRGTLGAAHDPGITRFTIPIGDSHRFPRLTTRRLVAVSPDGTQVVFPADNRLYVRSMGDPDAKPIVGTEEQDLVENPVFSPDGRWLAYYSVQDRSLKTIATSGGRPVSLCETVRPNGVSWGASGILFGSGPPEDVPDRGIYQVSSAGGKCTLVIAVASNETASNPQLLPDNETVIFTVIQGPAFDRWDKARIFAQSLKSGQRTALVEGGSDGRYLASGHIVYARGGTLYAIPFDTRQRRTTGEPVPMVDGVARSGSTGTAMWDVAANGTLVYVRGPAHSIERRLVGVSDRSGAVEDLKLPQAAYEDPHVSPDGKWIAVGVNDEKEAHIWVFDVAGREAGRRLTFEGKNRFPVWSSDGRRIVFQSDREGDHGLFWQLADGSGPPERLTRSEDGTSHTAESASSDGAHLLFRVDGSTTADRHLAVLSLKDRKTTPFADGQFSAFSFDGRWVAYTALEGDHYPIYVQPFPPTGARYRIWDDGIGSVWSKTRLELFSVAGARPEFVSVTPRPTFAFSHPVPIQLNAVGFGPTSQNLDTMPDGRLLILRNPGGNAPEPQINVVLNWISELTQRVTASAP